MTMFKCTGCGKEVDHLMVNGYGFGDRTLEGVMFTVKKDENGKIFCSDYPKDRYTKGLNMEHWVKRCNDYCDGLDIGTCPECGYDVDIEEE